MFFKKRRKKKGFFRRAIRSTFSIIILTAFVLGISFFIKEVSSLDSARFGQLTAPVLGRLGLSSDAAGEVAGEFVARFSQTKIVNDESKNMAATTQEETDRSSSPSVVPTSASEDAVHVAVLADSAITIDDDTSNRHLETVVDAALDMDIDYMIHVGDLTQWGDLGSLRTAKDILSDAEAEGVEWYAIPGDHDLGQSVGTDNFEQVFGATYELIETDNAVLMLFDNSANKTPLDEQQFTWFLDNVGSADVVFMSQPIYHPVVNNTFGVMGVFEGEQVEDVYEQAQILLSKTRSSDVQAIIAGDRHSFSVNTDPEDPDLEHITAGAVDTSEYIKLSPRFLLLTIYDNGEYDVEEVVVE